MIANIQGILAEVGPLVAIIEVQGLGYEVHLPLTTMEKLPPLGKRVKLHIHAVFREDSQTLYGFHNREDREFFRLLVEKVSGIGPKIALRIMSRLSVSLLKSAIASSDISLLSQCPGIGRKTAERLVLELKDKLSPVHSGKMEISSGTSSPLPDVLNNIQDAVTALMTLGYKAPEADKAVRRASAKLGPDAPSEGLIKSALS